MFCTLVSSVTLNCTAWVFNCGTSAGLHVKHSSAVSRAACSLISAHIRLSTPREARAKATWRPIPLPGCRELVRCYKGISSGWVDDLLTRSSDKCNAIDIHLKSISKSEDFLPEHVILQSCRRVSPEVSHVPSRTTSTPFFECLIQGTRTMQQQSQSIDVAKDIPDLCREGLED